jgi:hypothetical protein
MADARDLKSLIPRGVCGFDSRRRHFLMCFSCSRLNAPSRICLRFRAIFGQLLAILTFCACQREVRQVPHRRKGWVIFRENIPGPEAFRPLFPARLLSGQKAASSELQLSRCREERAAAKAAQLARGDMDAVQLTGRDRLIYGRALDAITATGVALDAAATEYAQAAKTQDTRFSMRPTSTCATTPMGLLAGWYRRRLSTSGKLRVGQGAAPST